MKPYFEDTIKDTKPTLVVFISAADQDAVEIKYLAQEIKAIFGDKINMRRVDVSFNHHITDKYRITKYPTWIVFKEGQELMRESGDKTAEELSDLVKRAL